MACSTGPGIIIDGGCVVPVTDCAGCGKGIGLVVQQRGHKYLVAAGERRVRRVRIFLVVVEV